MKTVLKIVGTQKNGQRETYYIQVERKGDNDADAELCLPPAG
jgi:hypothetical protein